VLATVARAATCSSDHHAAPHATKGSLIENPAAGPATFQRVIPIEPLPLGLVSSVVGSAAGEGACIGKGAAVAANEQ
jgi:hypothetical protein